MALVDSPRRRYSIYLIFPLTVHSLEPNVSWKVGWKKKENANEPVLFVQCKFEEASGRAGWMLVRVGFHRQALIFSQSYSFSVTCSIFLVHTHTTPGGRSVQLNVLARSSLFFLLIMGWMNQKVRHLLQRLNPTIHQVRSPCVPWINSYNT